VTAPAERANVRSSDQVAISGPPRRVRPVGSRQPWQRTRTRTSSTSWLRVAPTTAALTTRHAPAQDTSERARSSSRAWCARYRPFAMKVRVQVASPETRLWQFSAVAATAQSVSAVTRKPGSRFAMAAPPDLMTASSGTGGRTPCPQRASSPAVISTAEPYRNDCLLVPRSRTTIIGRMKIGSSRIITRKNRTLNRASGFAQPCRLPGLSGLVIGPLVAQRDTAVKTSKIRSGSGNFSRSAGT